MFTNDFKEGLRKMTMEIFESYECFSVNTFGIEYKLIPVVIGNTMCINAPITIGEELYQFYIDEGLGVKKTSICSFVVSQDC